MESDLVLWIGLVLFVVLALNLGRTVIKARKISSIVVMGDVHGDVTQHQASKPEPPSKPPLWRDLLSRTNVALGIIASAMIIGSLLLR